MALQFRSNLTLDLEGAAAPCVRATGNPSCCALDSVLISADVLSLYFVDRFCVVKRSFFYTPTMPVACKVLPHIFLLQ
jgi:hypothetical protein